MASYRPLIKVMNIFFNDPALSDGFKFNEFTEDIEYKNPPPWNQNIQSGRCLTDRDIIQIQYYISRIHNVEPSKRVLNDALVLQAQINSYHPVKKYIQSEEWDGVERLNDWLIRAVGCVDNSYTRAVSKCFLVAAVNRVYNPGCKFDHMMILEGAQGLGKSTLVEELASEWYLDTNFDNKDKDLIDCMRWAFLIEISELSGMNKREVDWLKSFMTKKTDRVRLAYAQRSEAYKRKSIFVGTYNPSGNNMYFRDDTGNRRFWPIECRSIDVGYVRENKGQLWAEAHHCYLRGDQYHITDPGILKIMLEMHEDRELESPTYSQVKQYLNSKPFISEFHMNDIIEDGLKIRLDGRPPKELLSIATTVGIIMRKLKWRKGTNENRQIYYRPEKQTIEQGVDWDE